MNINILQRLQHKGIHYAILGVDLIFRNVLDFTMRSFGDDINRHLILVVILKLDVDVIQRLGVPRRLHPVGALFFLRTSFDVGVGFVFFRYFVFRSEPVQVESVLAAFLDVWTERELQIHWRLFV